MGIYPLPSEENDYLSNYIYLITSSLRKLANIEIVDLLLNIRDQAKQVFHANYCLLAHNGTSDPVFNYGNQSTLNLFEYNWEEFTNMPSKYSAEADERAAREKFLVEVKQQGYSENYSGIRISKTGKRFKIEDVLLWNVLNEQGERIGQAAMIKKFEYL